jgi:hypothetical protein
MQRSIPPAGPFRGAWPPLAVLLRLDSAAVNDRRADERGDFAGRSICAARKRSRRAAGSRQPARIRPEPQICSARRRRRHSSESSPAPHKENGKLSQCRRGAAENAGIGDSLCKPQDAQDARRGNSAIPGNLQVTNSPQLQTPKTDTHRIDVFRSRLNVLSLLKVVWSLGVVRWSFLGLQVPHGRVHFDSSGVRQSA